MIDRIRELKIRVKRLNEMNNVDNAIDILDRNFRKEKRLNKMKDVDDAIDNLDINFNEEKWWQSRRFLCDVYLIKVQKEKKRNLNAKKWISTQQEQINRRVFFSRFEINK